MEPSELAQRMAEDLAEIERTPTELAAAPLFETLMRPGVPASAETCP